MKEFQDLIRHALITGVDQLNARTKRICRAIVGYQFEIDTSVFFPALTIRRMPIRNTVGELLGFFRGYDNAEDFKKLGCTFWFKNANETQSWLDNSYRQGTNHLGRIYGKQWTEWEDKRIIKDKDREAFEAKGYKFVGWIDTGKSELQFSYDEDILVVRYINQLEDVLRKLITDPTDRRCIVSGWNVAEFDMMALPPCHMDYKFVVIEGVLHCVMGIRSWDLYLGAPANIASTALFLAIMARLSGYKPGKIVIHATNAHLYDDSFEATELLLEREPLTTIRPTLWLSDNIKQITDLKDIKGAFARITPEDIKLVDYYPNEEPLIDKNGNKIIVEMAA